MVLQSGFDGKKSCSLTVSAPFISLVDLFNPRYKCVSDDSITLELEIVKKATKRPFGTTNVNETEPRTNEPSSEATCPNPQSTNQLLSESLILNHLDSVVNETNNENQATSFNEINVRGADHQPEEVQIPKRKKSHACLMVNIAPRKKCVQCNKPFRTNTGRKFT